MKKDIKSIFQSIKKDNAKLSGSIKRKSMKALPVFAMIIPGAAGVISYINAYNNFIDAQLMMRNAQLTQAQINMVNDYADNLFDYIRAVSTDNQPEMDRLGPLVSGVITGENQTELNILGDEAKKVLKQQLTNVDNSALTETAHLMGMKDSAELLRSIEKDHSGTVYETAKSLYKDNIFEQANFY